MKKWEMYREERKRGLTYQEIADKYGVSKQAVAQACHKYNPSYFRFWDSSSCIYPNVRNWLNENKITMSELIRRLGLETLHNNYVLYWKYLSGYSYLPKNKIDKLLSVTNLTYEQFFETDVQNKIRGDQKPNARLVNGHIDEPKRLTKDRILYWLYKWHDDGSFAINFEDENFDSIVDGLVDLKFEDQFTLFRFISMATERK